MIRWLILPGLLVACATRPGPADEATTPVRGPGPRSAPSSGRPAREVLVGQLCPAAASERPAVRPMFLRAIGWSDDGDEVRRPLERATARQFSRLAWDGRRAGLFTVIGSADQGGEIVAVGSYAGASSCDKSVATGSARELDPACVAALGDCGVAISVLEPAGGVGARPFGEDGDPPELSHGAACAAGGVLQVDIDGDGVVERYDASDLVDEARGPGDELEATDALGQACQPDFAQRLIVPAADPRDFQGVDLLAASDLDADGRLELLFAFRYAGRVTWALYGAPETPARLERLGEAVAWVP